MRLRHVPRSSPITCTARRRANSTIRRSAARSCTQCAARARACSSPPLIAPRAASPRRSFWPNWPPRSSRAASTAPTAGAPPRQFTAPSPKIALPGCSGEKAAIFSGKPWMVSTELVLPKIRAAENRHDVDFRASFHRSTQARLAVHNFAVNAFARFGIVQDFGKFTAGRVDEALSGLLQRRTRCGCAAIAPFEDDAQEHERAEDQQLDAERAKHSAAAR